MAGAREAGAAGRPAVFLDRDGTINVDKGYLFRAGDFEYLPGVVEGLRKLGRMGFLLAIVTNQSGIARGMFTEEDFQALNRWMLADLRGKGIRIAGVYHCPHLPGGAVPEYAVGCSCRKPATGLFWKAQAELGIDMGRSFAIGDRMRDLAICRESGVRGLLVGDGGPEGDAVAAGQGVQRCASFGGAVSWIEGHLLGHSADPRWYPPAG